MSVLDLLSPDIYSLRRRQPFSEELQRCLFLGKSIFISTTRRAHLGIRVWLSIQDSVEVLHGEGGFHTSVISTYKRKFKKLLLVAIGEEKHCATVNENQMPVSVMNSIKVT